MNSLFRTTHYFEDSTIFGDLSHAIDKTEEQFAKINEMFEEFKLNTITKDEFLSGIEDKADKEEIANIVSFYKNPLCIFTQKPPIWANNIF